MKTYINVSAQKEYRIPVVCPKCKWMGLVYLHEKCPACEEVKRRESERKMSDMQQRTSNPRRKTYIRSMGVRVLSLFQKDRMSNRRIEYSHQ